MDTIYGDSSPLMAMKSAIKEDNVTKIHDLVLANRRLKVRVLRQLGILKDRVGCILHGILSMRKLSMTWVPRLLTPNNKGNQTTSEQCLMLFKRKTKDTSPGERASNNYTVLLAGKVMATVFWDCQEKNDLVCLRKKCSSTTTKLDELGYELPPHPYSPDLASSDFFLFPHLKKSLRRQNFESNKEVIATSEAHFADLEKTYFSDGLKKFEHGWANSIELKEDYIEK
ncbi:hypothetical protein GWI33_010910 [Rhynchophorus ferrugineus]|uniref:Uncharacterized protein n=1 Tax=Rhynchophorus ferrugineus TaxID=354439 RepID=A0A834IBT3_RHYFE|nr:hypothetical protein GWI33_010910 [Rhynchophorus ferrugineus]